MSWQSILKNEDRLGLEQELEQLLRNEFKVYDFQVWDNHPWWTPDFYDRGITVNVGFTAIPNREENQTVEEMFEAGEGHFEIGFYSQSRPSNEEFAKAKYTLEGGYDVHEFNPEILDIDELKSVINALKRD